MSLDKGCIGITVKYLHVFSIPALVKLGICSDSVSIYPNFWKYGT